MLSHSAHGAHDLLLVGISVLVAIVASYVALDLAAQARHVSRRNHYAWPAAALAMGGGIWCMHFVGMLGFRPPAGDLSYDLALTSLSFVLAVLGTGVAFWIISHFKTLLSLLSSGVLMGVSVAAMHYTGMAALDLPFRISYDPALVTLSVLIAIAASSTALWLLLRRGGWAAQVGSAVAMGMAVAGMHYTGMAAVALEPLHAHGPTKAWSSLSHTHLALGVAATTTLILLLALATSLIERRRAEAVLRSEAEARKVSDLLKVTLDTMDQGLIMVDAEETIRVYNRRALELLDLPEDLMHGPRSYEAVKRYQRERGEFARSDAAQQHWLQTGNFLGSAVLYERERPNGSVLEVRSMPLPEGGAVRTFTDITVRKKAEEALRQSEERARDFANTASDWFWETDTEFRFTSIVGTTHDGALGQTLWEALEADPSSSPWSELAALLEARKPFRDFEYTIKTARGRTAWVSTSGHPVYDQNGAFIGYRGASRSITHRKRSEAEKESLREQLLQAQKMQAASTLSAGVSHDFNNLLVVVLGNAEILAEECSDPHHRALAKMIQDAAERGSDLTQKLLAFGRRQSLKPQRVSIEQVVEEMSPLLQRAIGAHIDYRAKLKDGAYLALTDRTLLESAILNLVVNARDAMPQGGTLMIESGEREAGPGEGPLPIGQPVTFVTVSDTGMGMKPEVLARAFEPFYTTKEVGKGSGLGLSMVYGFARQSGGHVTITSKGGKGTSVSIILPAVTPVSPPEAGAQTPEPAHAVGLGKILVVEDHADLRLYATSTLLALGYEVVEVPDGEAALEALKREQDIDLLFTDLLLPRGINGVDLAKRAQAARPGLQVLFTSGDEGLLEQYGHPGSDAPLLLKPYRRAELANAIQRVLKQQAEATAAAQTELQAAGTM